MVKNSRACNKHISACINDGMRKLDGEAAVTVTESVHPIELFAKAYGIEVAR